MSTPSAPLRRFNRDGSRLIYCKKCRDPIGLNSALMNFGSVSSCVLCDAAERGEVLPDNVIEAVKASRLALVSNTPGIQFVIGEAQRTEEARKTDPLAHNTEDFLSSRFQFRAAGLRVIQAFKDIVKKTPGSQKLAREKKRQRIFDRPIEEVIAEEDK